MASRERWKRAQSAERGHETHSGIPQDASWAQRHLESNFGVAVADLAEHRVLEVGSGTGMIHTFPEVFDTIGIDPLSSRLPVADSSATVMTGVGEQLPFQSDSVDVVICNNVLDHVLQPATVVSEIARILVRSGRLFLSVNVFKSPKLLRRLADRVDPPHPHHFSPIDIRNLVTGEGFDIEMETVHRHDISRWSNLRAFAAQTVFRIHQHHLLAVPGNRR